MPYPTGSDLSTFLIAEGAISAAPADLTEYSAAVQAASLDWERDTGWVPFLAGAAETRVFDGPEGLLLHLPVGLLSATKVEVDGTELVLNTDYYLKYQVPNGPWRAIEFGFYVRGNPRAVSITGVFGYQSALDASVRRAILSKAGSEVLGFLPGAGGQVRRTKAGSVEHEFDTTAGRDTPSRLLALYEAGVKRYRKWA